MSRNTSRLIRFCGMLLFVGGCALSLNRDHSTASLPLIFAGTALMVFDRIKPAAHFSVRRLSENACALVGTTSDALLRLLRPAAAFLVLGLVLLAVHLVFHDSVLFHADMNPARLMAHYAFTKAAQGGNYDMIIIGDSSVGSGVDTLELQRKTGLNILNLHATKAASPISYATYLRQFFDNGGHTDSILFIQHPSILQLEDNTDTFLSLYKELEALPAESLTNALTDYRSASQAVFPIPLKRAWGKVYGSGLNFYLHDTIAKHSWIDPLNSTIADMSPQEHHAHFRAALSARDTMSFTPRKAPTVSKFAERSFGLLAEILEEKFQGQMFIIFSPSPGEAFQYRSETARTMMEDAVFGLLPYNRTVILETPISFPAELMATSTHLNKNGKKVYTALIAEQLLNAAGNHGVNNAAYSPTTFSASKR